MKKMMRSTFGRLFIKNWVLAAILICGATLFTACSNQDHPATPDLNLSEKIIGKWIVADYNGQTLTTNEKTVFTFVSPTQALVSSSITSHPEIGKLWCDEIEADITINGNNMTLKRSSDGHKTGVEEFTVTAINDNEFTANYEINLTEDGKVVRHEKMVLRLEKLTTDFSADIIGTWEGRCTSEGSVFDDGQEHRWQYNADGTYVYYVKDGDDWVPYADNTLNEYFVDGTLLCTRWIDQGQENREWWEITIVGDKMNWTALRQKEDGSTYTATFEMRKVE